MENNIKKVAVYCGSSNKVDGIYKEETYKLGEALAKKELDLVFGSGDIGLMGAISETMRREGREIIGVTTEKIQESELPNPNVTDLVIVKTLRERKAKMDELSDAVIGLPGGFGTVDEVDEMIALKQLGEHKKPIVLFNINGFWDHFVKAYGELINSQFAKPEHITLFKVANSVDEVIEALYAEQKDLSKENWRL